MLKKSLAPKLNNILFRLACLDNRKKVIQDRHIKAIQKTIDDMKDLNSRYAKLLKQLEDLNKKNNQ